MIICSRCSASLNPASGVDFITCGVCGQRISIAGSRAISVVPPVAPPPVRFSRWTIAFWSALALAMVALLIYCFSVNEFRAVGDSLVGALATVLMLGVAIAVLLLPAIEAGWSKHPQSSAITTLNIGSLIGSVLLIQTPFAAPVAVVGWLIALVWANTQSRRA